MNLFAVAISSVVFVRGLGSHLDCLEFVVVVVVVAAVAVVEAVLIVELYVVAYLGIVMFAADSTEVSYCYY